MPPATANTSAPDISKMKKKTDLNFMRDGERVLARVHSAVFNRDSMHAASQAPVNRPGSGVMVRG